MITLHIEARDTKANLYALRKAGKMPAVFYGRKEKSTPISLKQAEFVKVWKKAGESSVVVLQGLSEDIESIIKDVMLDPVTDEVKHADFYVFEKGQKLRVKIPVELTGTAPAVKAGGVLVKVLHEIEVEAAPKDLPHKIIVDITPLENFSSQILAGTVALPQGVTMITGAEEVVVSVYEPKEEVEEVAAPVDLSAIEVEKKGKEAKEGEGEGEATDTDGKKA